MGLKPWEFERLTQAQFVAMHAGHIRALEWQRHTLAWLIAWVTAPHVKRPLSTDKILGISSHDEERRIWTEVGEAQDDAPRIILTDA